MFDDFLDGRSHQACGIRTPLGLLNMGIEADHRTVLDSSTGCIGLRCGRGWAKLGTGAALACSLISVAIPIPDRPSPGGGGQVDEVWGFLWRVRAFSPVDVLRVSCSLDLEVAATGGPEPDQALAAVTYRGASATVSYGLWDMEDMIFRSATGGGAPRRWSALDPLDFLPTYSGPGVELILPPLVAGDEIEIVGAAAWLRGSDEGDATWRSLAVPADAVLAASCCRREELIEWEQRSRRAAG